MNNKKGFTLIELLAVIVILGVIALIAVPSVNHLIDKSKKDALKSSATSLLDSAYLYYSTANKENNTEDTVFTIENGEQTSTDKLKYDGSIDNGTIILKPNGSIALCISDNGYAATNYNSTTQAISEEITVNNGSSCSGLELTTESQEEKKDLIEILETYNINSYTTDNTISELTAAIKGLIESKNEAKLTCEANLATLTSQNSALATEIANAKSTLATTLTNLGVNTSTTAAFSTINTNISALGTTTYTVALDAMQMSTFSSTISSTYGDIKQGILIVENMFGSLYANVTLSSGSITNTIVSSLNGVMHDQNNIDYLYTGIYEVKNINAGSTISVVPHYTGHGVRVILIKLK